MDFREIICILLALYHLKGNCIEYFFRICHNNMRHVVIWKNLTSVESTAMAYSKYGHICHISLFSKITYMTMSSCGNYWMMERGHFLIDMQKTGPKLAIFYVFFLAKMSKNSGLLDFKKMCSNPVLQHVCTREHKHATTFFLMFILLFRHIKHNCCRN